VVLRLSPSARAGWQVLTIVLVVLGLGLFLYGAVALMQGSFAVFPLALVGVILFGAGGMLGRLAFLRPVSELVATETESAVEHTASTVGRGLRSSWDAPAKEIRIRCRTCGFLASEDATYCSKCGKKV
jgi:hypothetical protein